MADSEFEGFLVNLLIVVLSVITSRTKLLALPGFGIISFVECGKILSFILNFIEIF